MKRDVKQEAQEIYDAFCKATEKVTGQKRPDNDPINGFLMIAFKEKGTYVQTIRGRMSANAILNALFETSAEISIKHTTGDVSYIS